MEKPLDDGKRGTKKLWHLRLMCFSIEGLSGLDFSNLIPQDFIANIDGSLVRFFGLLPIWFCIQTYGAALKATISM